MDRPVMFNRRLDKSEVDDWLNLLYETSETSFREHSLGKAFLHLPESIMFASSLENRIIGGTTIYRDKTRLSMVLASIAVKEEFRESVAFQIIKSSLPFFKTVAIRDVDALVSHDTSERKIGYPLSLELDRWVIDILPRIGFVEVGSLEHWSFEIGQGNKQSTLQWSKSENLDEVKELIWDQSKPMGLTNSFVWLARDFASNTNCLFNVIKEQQIAGVAGFWELSGTLCVSPIVTNPERVGWGPIAESLVSAARARDAKYLELPILGEGQKNLVFALADRCLHHSCRKLSLLRKPL